jgi:hypothetical protein
MGTTTNTLRRRNFPISPSYTSREREIAQVNKFETQFIPLASLPSKGTTTLDSNSLNIRLSYDISGNEPLTIFRAKNVSIEFGANTHRIFQLGATFGESSFRMLGKRVGDINKGLDELGKQFSPDTKKNYQIIKDLVNMTFSEIQKHREEIEKDLFTSESMAPTF